MMVATVEAPARPTAPDVVDAGIPDELKTLPRWVGWSYRVRAGRWAKVPVRCPSGRQAKTTDPATWSTFAEALSTYKRRSLDGVGFVFADGDPFTGVDLDDCRDPGSGRLEPWAEEIVRELDSYTEVSPSGTGVKIIVRGALPQGSRTRKGEVEVYSRGRYFTITGLRLTGTPETVQERQDALRAVHGRHLGEEAVPTVPAGYRPLEGHTDEEVVALAKRAANGEKFARLWEGDTSGYGSDSEADLALCGILAYYVGPDEGRIERLFGRSELAGRGKWRDRDDYRRRTIETAIRGTLTRRTSPTRSYQITRTEQEEYTVIPPPGGGAFVGGEIGNVDERLASGRGEEDWGQGEGEGVRLALAYADQCGDAPDWEAAFTLGRKLYRLSDGGPEGFEREVRAFCGRSGRPFEEFWYEFLARWEKIRTAEGEDVLAWAVQEAGRSPYEVTPCPGEKYAALASVAYHLSRHTHPAPFCLPQARLAECLGTTATTIGTLITLLRKDEVIECVKEDYSYAKGLAKEYVFLGGRKGA